MRLIFADKQGPLREVHSGSGYWSQDGAEQVLATPTSPEKIEVRWPFQKPDTIAIPANAHEVEIRPDGVLKVLR